MERQRAQTDIKDILQKPFHSENFTNFVHNLLNDIEPRDNHYRGGSIWEAYRDHIAQYWRIGKYTDPNGETLDILVVETKSLSKLDRARTSLRNFVVRHLKQFEKEVALVAFYAKEDNGSDWRFSFVKIEREAKPDDKGKVKLKSVLSPAKRYSYLVGQHEHSYTAQKQLIPLLERDYANPTIEEIEAAFSVEKVTNEFFEQYKELYLKLSEQVTREPSLQSILTKAKLETNRFTKKLLGQIVFLYFVQKKGWLGVPTNEVWGKGNRRFLRDLFIQAADSGKNFYVESLQYLFYEALAQKRADSTYLRFGCKIPFLNGGLFEADYDWENERLTLPNELFSNTERNKAGDEGTGILDVFDRYNFTIKEDEPLEKEVAVDPEMLGKVFENMLEIAERKSKGAFYTPREIVHYMCQESLIHYLDNALNNDAAAYRELGSTQITFIGTEYQTGQLTFTEEQPSVLVPKQDLEELIRNGHLRLENDQRVQARGRETDTYGFQLPEAVRTHAARLDEKLRTIKICDPAIGSGAFPVGLLHEIVNSRLVLQAFSGKNESAYALKRHAILESIYGVDIDPSAIDIARLRLWLSLIVDEDDFESIDALPNLDYKIVQGNSLIGFPEKLIGSQSWSSPAIQGIEQLKQQFSTATDLAEKQQLKTDIDEEISRHLASSRIDFDFRFFFSEVWRDNKGFDIVIGNPPYIQIQKYSGQRIQKDLEEQKYETFTKTGDIYCLFYEKGYRLLHEQGVLAFITSNKWMRAAYGEKLRQFFIKRTAIEQLIDFGDSPIFSEATTYTNILIFQKTTKQNQPTAWDLSSDYRKATSLLQMLEEHPGGAAIFSNGTFVIVPPEFAAIKQRIEQVGVPLQEWDIDIYRGIVTGLNEAFIIDGKKKDELIAQDPKSAEIIKPILRGRDIKRYRADFADLWVITTFPALNLNINDYPAICEYLSSFGKKLHQTGEIVGRDAQGNDIVSRKKTGNQWFETQDQISYYPEFEKEKIIYAEIVFDSAFFFDSKGFYPEATAFTLTGQNIKYLTAVLNSRLLTFVFKTFYAGGDLRGNTFRYKKVFLENLPVAEPQQADLCLLETLMDYIQVVKKVDMKLQSAYFEQLIDGLVYELYFPEELKTANKELLAHLGNLTPISDEMSEEAKLAIIQLEFERLYDPRHPVRNHLETLDSVEEVRIIQESLK